MQDIITSYHPFFQLVTCTNSNETLAVAGSIWNAPTTNVFTCKNIHKLFDLNTLQIGFSKL